MLEAAEGTAREGAFVPLPSEGTPAALHLGWAGRGVRSGGADGARGCSGGATFWGNERRARA